MSLQKFADRLTTFFVNYFTLKDQLLPQADAEADIREGVSFRGMNIIILILAILIASLGLNTNSTAVIIGAMLISPLMGPIIGIGLGVGIHDYDLIKRALRNLIMAAAVSVLASTIYFLISPVGQGHSELLARTSPTIYDVLIGFVGGAAGILAIGSKYKGNVIPGVAIATALMPPLCTAGYGLATLQMNYFFGAFYLFLINSIYIALSTFIGVKLMKYKAAVTADTARERRVRRIVYTVAILTLLPSIYLTYNMLRQNKFERNAQAFVTHECRFPDTQVLNSRAYMEDGERIIDIALIGRPLPADSLELALTNALPAFHLEGTRIRIIQGNSNTPTALEAANGSVRDIYQLAQNTITRQQQTIDSLRAIGADIERMRGEAIAIAPEVKVVFPAVADLALARQTVFSRVGTATPDTLNVALAHFTQPMSAAQLRKFSEYLQARLQLDTVYVVDVEASMFNSPKKSPNDEHRK